MSTETDATHSLSECVRVYRRISVASVVRSSTTSRTRLPNNIIEYGNVVIWPLLKLFSSIPISERASGARRDRSRFSTRFIISLVACHLNSNIMAAACVLEQCCRRVMAKPSNMRVKLECRSVHGTVIVYHTESIATGEYEQ
jgi:hypothetical protein